MLQSILRAVLVISIVNQVKAMRGADFGMSTKIWNFNILMKSEIVQIVCMYV